MYRRHRSRDVQTSGSRQHAQLVISQARIRASGTPVRSRDLTLLAEIGNHVNKCSTCRRVWADGHSPVWHLDKWAKQNRHTRHFWTAARLSA